MFRLPLEFLVSAKNVALWAQSQERALSYLLLHLQQPRGFIPWVVTKPLNFRHHPRHFYILIFSNQLTKRHCWQAQHYAVSV